MKILFSLCTILFLFSQHLKAEIPQIERDALLSIAENLEYPNGWDDDMPIEQWYGVTIELVNGTEHVVALNISKSINGFTGNVSISDDYKYFDNLKKLKISLLGSNSHNLLLDFEIFENVSNLEELEIRFPSTNSGNNYIFQNISSLPTIENLKVLNIWFDSPNFILPTNFSDLTQLTTFIYRNNKLELPNNLFSTNSITELSISCDLDGSFPNHINNLSQLENLKKLTINQVGDFNYYNGPLPDIFYNLQSIESLSFNIDNIYISELISNYSNQLKSLTIHSNNLNYHPKIYSLFELTHLELRNGINPIEISPYIENITDLESLVLKSETTIHLPSTIKNLQSLSSIILYPSEHSTFVDELYQIPNLKVLAMNVFDEIPEQVNQLSSIEHLQFISKNGLLTHFPESIGTIEQLKKLDLIYEDINSNLIQFPSNYFNWPNLTQLWVSLKTEIDVTNKFLNSPFLEALALDYYQNSHVTGFLNLCQNPNIRYLEITSTNISGMDFRNNQAMATNENLVMAINNNPITKFLVDDVNIFNQLRDENKIRITNNTTNFTVETSNSECFYVLGTSENLNESSYKIYPNPVKNHLYIESLKNISNVEIRDLSGKKIEIDSDNPKIFVGLLPKGIYILKFQMDGIYYKEKFIKK